MPEELQETDEQDTLENPAENLDESQETGDERTDADVPDSGEVANTDGEETTPVEEISENRRALARSYGFSDSEIEALGNDSRIDAVTAAMDRSWHAQSQAPEEQGQQRAPQSADQQTAASEAIKLTLDGLDDDDPLRPKLEQVAKFMDQEQQRVQRLEQAVGWTLGQFQQKEQEAFWSEFDAAADASNLAILGKGRNPVRGQIAGQYEYLRKTVGLSKEVALERAARAAFPQEFEKREQIKRANAIRARSGTRTGATSRSTKTDYTGDVAGHPEVQAIMRRMATNKMNGELAGV